MDNNRTFTYQYSANQNKEVETIRKKYVTEEESEIDKLRKMDRKVRMAGIVPGLTVGIIGCLIFGIGMCFGLDIFAGDDIFTLLFCGMGLLTMLPAYPVYKYVENETRERLVPEILRLSDKILKI